MTGAASPAARGWSDVPRAGPVGVVVPVHDEQELLPACLASLTVAARQIDAPVLVVVALDACSDGSAAVAAAAGATTVALERRCVGAARRAGAAVALAAGAGWLASTDADSVVDPGWLLAQQRLAEGGADAVCGVVAVTDWGEHHDGVRHRFAASYAPRDGHRHVHGASMGVSAAAYTTAGGWPPLPAHEDVALVEALQGLDAVIAWSAGVRVVTSARRQGRTRGGFADHLVSLATPA